MWWSWWSWWIWWWRRYEHDWQDGGTHPCFDEGDHSPDGNAGHGGGREDSSCPVSVMMLTKFLSKKFKPWAWTVCTSAASTRWLCCAKIIACSEENIRSYSCFKKTHLQMASTSWAKMALKESWGLSTWEGRRVSVAKVRSRWRRPWHLQNLG